MRRTTVVMALFLLTASAARADYAVLRSGERLHFTSREQVGDMMRLKIPGGRVDLPADQIVSIEPEDVFAPNPARRQPPVLSAKLFAPQPRDITWTNT